MFCKHCGKQIPDNSNVCQYCGQNVVRPNRNFTPPAPFTYEKPDPYTTVHTSIMTTQIDSAPNTFKKKSKPPKILIPIIAIVLVVAIVLSIFGINMYKTKRDAEDEKRLTEILKESTDKPIIEFYFDDYDGNKTKEAYAVVGGSTEDGDRYFDADVWFVNRTDAQMIADNISGTSNGTITAGDNVYISFENSKDDTSVNYSFIYGVKNDKPFESETSGKYHDVHEEDGKILAKEDENGDFIEIEISDKEHKATDDYSALITQYEKVVKNRLNLEEMQNSFGEYVNEQLVIILRHYSNYGSTVSNDEAHIYYALYDINGDRTRECVIGMGTNPHDVSNFGIFTHDGKKPVPLFGKSAFGERSYLTLLENGVMYLDGSGGAALHSYEYCKLPPNSQTVESLHKLMFEDYVYYEINDMDVRKEISEDEFNSIQEKYGKSEIDLDWIEIIPGEAKKTDSFDSKLIEFGSYPQSRETDVDTIASLDSMVKEWTSYKYYCAIGEAGTTQMDDYMQYTDVICNGEKYRGVKFTKYRPIYTASLPSADKSYQDENGYFPNEIYWFRYEPLLWRVLDADDGYVICENIIDSQPYSSSIYLFQGNYWNDSEFTNPTNDYSTSTIRAWLNVNFYHTAFTEAEKALIASTLCDNVNPEDASHSFRSTTDHVFLPSYADILNTDYGFNANAAVMDKERRATGTDYAKCQGLWVENSGNYIGGSWSWLRSPRDNSRNVYCVNANGNAHDIGIVDGTDGGVRPAMKLTRIPESE